MTKGDEAFFKHKYYRALHYYLFAWGLFPKSVDQSFAINMVWNNAHELLNVDIKKQLIDASAQTFRFSHLLGPTMPIISPGEAPEAVLVILSMIPKKGNKGRIIFDYNFLLSQFCNSQAT